MVTNHKELAFPFFPFFFLNSKRRGIFIDTWFDSFLLLDWFEGTDGTGSLEMAGHPMAGGVHVGHVYPQATILTE